MKPTRPGIFYPHQPPEWRRPDWVGTLDDPASWMALLERERQHRERRKRAATDDGP